MMFVGISLLLSSVLQDVTSGSVTQRRRRHLGQKLMKRKPQLNVWVVISHAVAIGRSGALSRRRSARLVAFLMRRVITARVAAQSAHGNANRRNAIRLVLRSVDRLCAQHVARTSTPKVAR